MKRKFRSSDTYYPSDRPSSSDSYKYRRKKRKVSIDYGKRKNSTSSMGLTDYSSSGSVYSGSSGGKFVAATAGAQFGRYYGGIPGAIVGEKAAEYLYDHANTYKFAKNNMPAMFTGRFRKPKPFSTSVYGLCSKYGYVMENEYYGTVTDSNSAMLIQSTYSSALLGSAICTAAIRKLFKKAGICIADRDGSLGLYSPYNADGFKVMFQVVNPITGGNITTEHPTVANDTLTTYVAATGFIASFVNYFNKASENIPSKMYLYSSDRNGVDTNWRLASQLDLTAETITIVSNSRLTLQNQTKAATAISNDTDRNDTQPLTGVMYQFRNEPRLKSIGNVPAGTGQGELIKFQGAGYTGIRLLKGGDFVNTSFQNPPNVGMFSNCIKKTGLTLQPGEMKSNVLTHQTKGKMINILPKMRMEQFGLTPIKVHGTPCKSALFHFSEQMRTVSTNPVIVAYEHSIKVGVMLTTNTVNVALQNDTDSIELNL